MNIISSAMMKYSLLALGLCASVFAQHRVNPKISEGVDDGMNIVPNIQDPSSPNAQTSCPGYKASNVKRLDHGVEATLRLAGAVSSI
jgi:hypothetical protein